MKVYGGAEVLLHSFLTLALDGERSATCPGCFTSGKRNPQYLLKAEWASDLV